MDTETKQNDTQAGQTASDSARSGFAAGGNSAASNSTTANGKTAPDMMTLLGKTSLPASVCGWLSCLRKSGMSLTYSLQKRHIPDMDQPQSAQGCQNGGHNGGQSVGNGQNASSGDGNPQTTGTSDTMTCSGSCSIRYFDLAVGAMLVLTVCGILKGCRCMKRWF